MEYKKRIVDGLLDLKLEAFGATLIKGPKGCGKTTSAKQKEAAEMYINFMCEPDIAYANIDYICYSTPHSAAYEMLPLRKTDSGNKGDLPSLRAFTIGDRG